MNPTAPSEPIKKGNTSLPSSKEELMLLQNFENHPFKYSVEDFFCLPQKSGFKISPSGQFVSYLERTANGKSMLCYQDLETLKTYKIIEEKNEVFRKHWWASDDIILFLQDTGGDENTHLFKVHLDGSNLVNLTPFQGVKVNIIQETIFQKEFLGIQMNLDNRAYLEPYKINIHSGALQKLYEEKDPENPILVSYLDKEGCLRAIIKKKDMVKFSMYYRVAESEDFELVIAWDSHSFFELTQFNYASSNPHEAYVLTSVFADKTQLIRYDLKAKKELGIVFKEDKYDIKSVQFSKKKNFEIESWCFDGAKETYIPVSEECKNIFANLAAVFKNCSFKIYDKSEDETTLLVIVYSDKMAYKYYSYHTLSKQTNCIASMFPNLAEDDMASMLHIEFAARDGLKLEGYLSIPKNNSEQKYPLIVNPHGGPYGPRDSWGFNPEAQLFASRGLATLQLNYRGSGGFGKSFLKAGFKQVGRKMLDDLEDGVAFVTKNFAINEQKIAIYGGSYGGLATLGSLIKTPNLYRCGVDYVGVSNLFSFVNTIPTYWKPFLEIIFEQWYNPAIEEEKKIMLEVSPSFHVDKISKPLLVVHGANDPRVNIDEADQIVLGLRNRGIDVPYLVKYNEGHGFAHEENKLEFYKTMLGFFQKELHLTHS